MRLLLDTRLLLWAAGSPARLGGALASRLEDPANTLHASVASVWEVTIKAGFGREDFRVDAVLFRAGLRAAGYIEVDVRGRHVERVSSLPPLHRDPFDRLLVAQARAEELTLLTRDARVAAYGEAVELV